MHTVKTLNHEAIEAFKLSWPCHGFPDAFTILTCWFGTNGDLLDYQCQDADGRWVDVDDGAALVALVQDCQSSGTLLTD